MQEFRITSLLKCLQTFQEVGKKDIFNVFTEPYSQVISKEIQVTDVHSTK